VDLTVSFAAGEVAAVLGPNGAGKSTLLGILSTLVRPTTGHLTFGGQSVTGHSLVRTTIGYVGHEPGLYRDLTAPQTLQLFAHLYGLPEAGQRIDQMLERWRSRTCAATPSPVPSRAACSSGWPWP